MASDAVSLRLTLYTSSHDSNRASIFNLFQEDFEKYSSHKKLYHTFRDMAGYLLIAALGTCRTDILKVLDELNSRY